jgi:hypothetical protein
MKGKTMNKKLEKEESKSPEKIRGDFRPLMEDWVISSAKKAYREYRRFTKFQLENLPGIQRVKMKKGILAEWYEGQSDLQDTKSFLFRYGREGRREIELAMKSLDWAIREWGGWHEDGIDNYCAYQRFAMMEHLIKEHLENREDGTLLDEESEKI